MKTNLTAIIAVAIYFWLSPIARCADPKVGAENMNYSRDFYSKVHMVEYAKLEFEAPPASEFQYDRYPNGGPERIKSGDGGVYARKDGKTWLESEDWGDTGKPADAETMGGLEFRADAKRQ